MDNTYRRPLTRRDGPSQRRTTKRLTGRQGRYGKPLTGRNGPYRKGRSEGRSLREGPVPYGKGRVLHREGRRRGLREGRALTGSPLRGGTVLTGRAGPYGKGRGPLRGWVPSQRRTTFNYRKAYRKLRGGTLPELGGNSRLCAVDQKRSFFPRVGPFLDLLPFKGPFPLTGALTGTYGETSYGKAVSKAGPLREAPYKEGRSLREGPVPYGKGRGPLRVLHREGQPLQEAPYEERRSYEKGRSLTGRAGVPYGSFTETDDEEAYWKAGALREAPYGQERDGPYGKGRSLREGPLQGWLPSQKKDDKEAYWKAERLREAPYGEGRSLREGPVLTGIYRGPYGQTALREGPLRGGFLREGPLRITGKLTGTLTGRASYGEGRSLQEGSGWALMRRESPLRGRALTAKEGPEGQGLLHPLPRFRVI